MQARPLGRLALRLGSAVALLLMVAAPVAAQQPTVFWEDLVARARKLASQPFSDDRRDLPPWLVQMTYDQWRDIRYRPERALWANEDLPFQVQFFHPGFYYNRAVTMNVLDPEGGSAVHFSPNQFDYGRNDFASRVPPDLGFAGFRLHAPIKTPTYFDEVMVFLGATYFRGVGKNQGFGLSARGLAIDTAEPRGEEFPFFREFWIEKPTEGAREVVVYALLDSPRITGAYRFVIRPGQETVNDVSTVLFARAEIGKLGIAPLTSMFFHGENTTRRFDDFRPEAHDSDGLLAELASGEWIWRPLDNPRTLQVHSIATPETPRGFGLIQRDRSFESYQDLETRQELRPSAWIEPQGDWGAGRIQLVEIPTKSDTNDNIVLYWVPDRAVRAGDSLEYAYRLFWYGEDLGRPPLARAVATWRDRGAKGETERVVIDFSGPELDAIPADEVLHGQVSARRGDQVIEPLDLNVVKNPEAGGFRLTLEVPAPRSEPTELRAALLRDGKPVTETWTDSILP